MYITFYGFINHILTAYFGFLYCTVVADSINRCLSCLRLHILDLTYSDTILKVPLVITIGEFY